MRRVGLRSARLRRGAAAGLAAGALLLGACGDGGPMGATATAGPDLDAIREARDAYGPVAQELGAQVLALEELVRVARLEPEASVDGVPAASRRAAVDAIELAASGLDEFTEVVEVDLGDDPLEEPAVLAARDAFDDAVGRARLVVEAARDEAAHLRTLLDAEAELADVTAGWDAPGSRSQQRGHFAELVARARAVVTSLDVVDEVPDCAGAVAARQAAALLVAERTEELRGYVDRGQGRSFDEARARFDAEPWHAGLPGRDAEDAGCWEGRGPVVVAADAVQGALDRLVAALNTGSVAPSEAG